MTQRSIGRLIVFSLAIGSAVGVYGVFAWIIPFMNSTLFPWMARLERTGTVPRSVGLMIMLAAVLAWFGMITLFAVRYLRFLRTRLRRPSER